MQTTESTVIRLRLNAAEARAVYEARLQHLWQELDCTPAYGMECHRRVIIHSPGTINHGAGPDFLNARIEIDGKSMVGDIEIHRKTSFWFQHQHHLDPRYRGVILHVVEEDDLPSDTELPPVLTFEQLKTVSANRVRRRHKCHLFFNALSNESIAGMLTAAAMQRFESKAEKILQKSLEHGLNHASTLAIADALGYRNNRDAFAGLANRYLEHPEEDRNDYAEAIIWGESGLLPDPAATPLGDEMKEFLSRIWKDWGRLRLEARPPLPWVRHGNRPYNSPERRVAALVGLLARSSRIARAENMNASELARTLMTELTVSDPLWDRYTSFETTASRPAAIVGRDRALELAMNVTLPVMHAEGMMERNPQRHEALKSLSRDTWLELPPSQDNQIVRRVKQEWFKGRDATGIFTTAAVSQGAIQLYREFCESCQSDCASCLFYNSL